MTELQRQILDERIFISAKEAATMLKVSRSYVYRLVRHRRLQGTKEKPVRITTSSFRAFVEERSREKPASY